MLRLARPNGIITCCRMFYTHGLGLLSLRLNLPIMRDQQPMMIAGNSFTASHERWCSGRLPHRSPDRCPCSVVPSDPGVALLEQPLAESGYPIVGAFNDMALHLFPPGDVHAPDREAS